MPMRLIALLAALLLAGAVAAGAQGSAENSLLLDTPNKDVAALDFTSETLDGETVRLRDHRGKVVLLNFWATWCVPCLLEMPAMDRLNDKLAGRPFKLLAVNQAESREQIARFDAEHGFGFDLVLDPDGRIGSSYAADRLPMSYIIDPRGKVIRRAIGPREWDSPEAVALFERLMAETGAGEDPTATRAQRRETANGR